MNKARFYLSVIIPALLAVCFSTPVLAGNATVTAATGGTMSSSTIASGTWTALTGPKLVEAAPSGMGAGTIVFNAPAGFIFNVASPVTVTVTGTGTPGADTTLASSTATINAAGTTITITVTKGSTGQRTSTLTWSGIKVRPTACSPLASGNITNSGTAAFTPSSANYGTLTETGSTALAFIQQPSNALFTAVIAPAVTLNACGAGALPTVTVALTTPAGATLSGTLSVATNNATGLVTFSNLSVNLVGSYTLTATSPGLTSAISSSFIIYYPVPTTTSISPISANLGGASFTMIVNGTNFVPASVARFNGVNRATTYVSATQLTVTILAADLAVAGTFPVDVVNPVTSGLGGGTSNSQSFQVVNILPGRFNTFETSTAAGAIIGNIFTKIAGTAFNLDVVALNLAKTAVLTTFAGAVKVELLDASNNAGVLDVNNCRSTWTTVIQTLAPNPTFVVADNGRKSVSFTESNAWKEVRIRVSYPTGAATAIGCSTDTFAIRPNSLSLSVTDADWQTAGITRILNNVVAATTPPVHKAGQPFTLRATALNSAAVTTTNYTGTPSAILSACVGTACTATFGTFSMGAGTAVAGVINSTTATYSEAGAFSLLLQDQTFASVDAADGTPATCAGRYACSAALNVGRFVPDHFALSAASVANRAALTCLTCTFTYMGEQLNAIFTMTAQSAGNAATLNYTGALAKLVPTTAVPVGSGGPLGLGMVDNGTPVVPFTVCIATPAHPCFTPGTATAGSFANGVATGITVPLTVYRGATAVGPFAALDIGIAPTDSDGVTMSAYDLDADAVAGNDHSKVARTEVRYGRMKISNAHGSELLPLPITMTAQYWDGTAYVTNTLDNSSSFPATLGATGVVDSNYQKNLNLGETSVITPPASVVFVNGVAGYRLAAPGANNNGSVDMTVNALSAYLPVGSAARATFGVYKGANQFIYQRENY